MNLNSLYFDVVNYAIGLCIFITFMVAFYLVWVMNFSGTLLLEVPSESSLLEFFWTLLPSLLVLMLCFYNVSYVLKDFELIVNKSIKIIGRQWYWCYEFDEFNYDSYMTQLVNNVDKPLVLNHKISYRLLITSADVIHSFSLPDLGIKSDAIPGRINQVNLIPDYLGVFVGYCSELCGAGHSYMPIVVEVIK
uniref:Cytochrome c oxidase subunit 2 n=1 Tax=Megalobenedenia derzhavini TaxID=3068300 RepID=A0AA49QK14_9PLAT|nr:cytochrome c oxidase subunit II [Megalobenedenia derzhavini]WLG31375.1 cytochrome c oxidase subunit II [Megalobenedenia derzhavini]